VIEEEGVVFVALEQRPRRVLPSKAAAAGARVDADPVIDRMATRQKPCRDGLGVFILRACILVLVLDTHHQ